MKISDTKIGISMKTMKYIAGAVLALAGLVACNQKEESVNESVEITITATQEGHDALTKTAVEDGGTQVFWEPSDEIKVFFKGSGGRFISQNTEKAAVAEKSRMPKNCAEISAVPFIWINTMIHVRNES